ncbi:MAG: DUF2752 domain-containing protein [Bacteroidales bacterium]|nr:DUF2752 domain-containing protein [Bacteroidales bacterium]
MDIKDFKSGWIFILIIIIIIVLYKIFDPYDLNYFPKCPFRELTGYKCPGCGSQRAIHYLLNFEIIPALKENVLLVLSIPYIIAGIIFDLIKNPNEKLLRIRRMCFGVGAIKIILFIIIIFWILRNL